MTTYYTYSELLTAVEQNDTKENRMALWLWFERHGDMYWNGVCYNIDSGRDLYPVYAMDTMTARELIELADKLGGRDDVTLEDIVNMDELNQVVDCEIR